ncbi:MAG: hypothetical protein HY846_02300 [Nitrosomonadales bacterium]|nr:hypothetical protein [Nitrosomonadales bacterium]
MPATLEMFDTTIVAIGAFNPAIFSPEWLMRTNLIGNGDAASANENKSLIISRQVAVIESDWFVLQVLEDRFSLTSKGAVTPSIKDLAAGIMSLIPQTPIQALGLNFSGHYKFANLGEFHKVGDVLAPKEIWGKVFPDGSAGMASLTIKIQPCKRDEPPETGDEINVTVQRSTKIRATAIHFSFNDHKNISERVDESITSAECVASLIDKEWDTSRERSISTFENLIKLSLE